MVHLFPDHILRNIYKFVYKIFFPKEYKHNRRFWPLYQVQRNERGGLEKVFFRKKLVSNNLEKIDTENKKCMLIATGPSIQLLGHEQLHRTDIDYIGVNGAISLDHILFKNYVIIDHNFIECRFDLVKKVLLTKCTFYTTPRCLDMILREVKFEDIFCTIKVIETITRDKIDIFLDKSTIVDKTNQNFYIHNEFGFSKDIFQATFDYFTVAYVALQVINTIRYEEIYIAGLDMSNFSKPRFYETSEDKQPTLLDIHTETVLSAFDTAALFFQENGTKVYNLSKDSAVQSFEKIDCNTL